MTTLAPAAPAAPSEPIVSGGVRNAYETELSKLLAQLTTRILILVCALGPLAFAAVLKIQSGTPSDALFGFWVHTSGFAISLVILGFAGSWGFPIIAGVLAGDLFSSEDRHGTWKTILTRSCTREDVFAGKLLAVAASVVGLMLVLAASSLIAGIVLVGAHALVNLSGVLTSPGRMLALTAVSWLICLLPVLAYTSLAVLFSVATRNGILGVLGPLLVALITQLLDLIGKGVIVHELLIGSAFDGWHGLFTSHPYFGQLIVGSVVSRALDRRVPDRQLGDHAPARLPHRGQRAGAELDGSTQGRGGQHRRDRCPRVRVQPRADRGDRLSGLEHDRSRLQQRHPAAAATDRPVACRRTRGSTSDPSATGPAPSRQARGTGVATSTCSSHRRTRFPTSCSRSSTT